MLSRHVLAGIGQLNREEICQFLAQFEDAELWKILVDRGEGWLKKSNPWKDDDAGTQDLYALRIQQSSDRLTASPLPTPMLRLRLWTEIRQALDQAPELPLSSRSAARYCADIADQAAQVLGPGLSSWDRERKGERWSERFNSLKKVHSLIVEKERYQFAEVGELLALQLLTGMAAQAADNGALDKAESDALLETVRSLARDLPPEFRDRQLMQALETGNMAGISVAISTLSLGGLATAVQVSGFSAYILAAQASAFIPFVSGPGLVSMLAIAANPIFFVPAILVSVFGADRWTRKRIVRHQAAIYCVILGLRGLSGDREGEAVCLDDFRGIDPDIHRSNVMPKGEFYSQRLKAIRRRFGQDLPPAPGKPPVDIQQFPARSTEDRIGDLLFDSNQASTGLGEALATGGLYFADIVYTAASIEPAVVAAADFSREADIDYLVSFGAFAERHEALAGAARTGFESNLQGYVAEQIVATRLVEQGHQVSFPEAANNAGFDLLIDGDPFQVKCLASAAGLAEHFERFPDIPVIANAELASHYTDLPEDWSDRIFFIEGYDRETTLELVQSSLDAGAGLDDFDVPIFAAAVTAARNIHGWWRGSISLSEVPWETGVDVAIAGSLATAGGFAGGALGLLLFGPAGALILPGVTGAAAVAGRSSLRAFADKQLNSEWLQELDANADLLLARQESVLSRKRAILVEKATHFDHPHSREQIWLRLRFDDDLVAIAEAEADLSDLRSEKDPERKAFGALKAIYTSGTHFWSVGERATSLQETIARRPPLSETMTETIDDIYHSGRDWFSKQWRR